MALQDDLENPYIKANLPGRKVIKMRFFSFHELIDAKKELVEAGFEVKRFYPSLLGDESIEEWSGDMNKL